MSDKVRIILVIVGQVIGPLCLYFC